MKQEVLNIANIKCGGCAHSITTKISGIDGVSDVKVDFDNGEVDVTYSDDATRATILDQLSSMGYPEATEENGLLMKAKSYANCMIGKVTK
ncbi:MAG: heavy-metal-associated domain-containing protein [Bacteroidia bacterium]